MSKTIFNFSKLRDAELDQQAENVLVKLTGNAMFPNPTPDLTVLEADLLAFRSAMVDANLRSRQSIIIRDQKRAALEKTLRLIAYYVDGIADGDKALVLSAGYPFVKEAENSKPCPKPTGLTASYGLLGSGQANVRVKPEKTARAYRFEYRLAGTDNWTEQIVTRASTQFSGLQSMQTYEFRVAYIGTDPTVTYSEVVSSLVL